MFCREMTQAATRYKRRVMTAMTGYFFALYSSSYMLHHLQLGSAQTITLAILPSLPILAVLTVIGLYLREESDEFQRNLTMETLLWGMGGTLALATTYGFIEQFLHTEHFAAYWVFVPFWCFTGIARMVYWLRFREPRDDQ